MSDATEKRCDGTAVAIFLAGLTAGTANAIFSKSMFQLKIVGNTGIEEPFTPKLMSTFLMFTGMSMALFAHVLTAPAGRRDARVPLKTYALLSVPALFDLCATALGTLGLLLLPLSMWQLLRGSVIVFVALMKRFLLGDHLASREWAGVLIVTLAITLVGLVGAADMKGDRGLGDTLAGVLLTLGGTFVSSLQFAVEEKLMSGQISAPPMLLVGMEGVCGLCLTTVIVYPLYYALPGQDHGHFEDVWNTLAQLRHSPEACWMAACYTVLVFLFNVFGMQVTQRLSSIWKAILNNLRPASIWATQLVLYSATAGQFGEAWAGTASWLQLGGLSVLVLGIAIYNGSIPLPGVQTPPAEPPLLGPLLGEASVISPVLGERLSGVLTREASDPSASGRAQALKVKLLPK